MHWAHDYYTQQSRTFGRAVVTEHNRRTAAMLDGWARDSGVSTGLLELGAGAGGLAAALVDLGRRVVAVEFNPSDAAFARALADERSDGALSVVEGNFYTVDLEARFDFVYYWDGFGIGSDAEQRRLLQRIARDWLTTGGQAVLDVFSPWNWQRHDGETSTFKAKDGTPWTRTVHFDAVGSRLVDSWCPEGDEHTVRSQTIRCYTIPELILLLEGTGLRLEVVRTMDGTVIDPDRTSEDVSHGLMNTNGYFAIVRRTEGD